MKRRPKASSRSYARPEDRFAERPDPREERSSSRGAIASAFSAVSIAVLAAVFVLGIGIGVAFSSATSAPSGNISTRYDLDKMAPNPEICAQFGASAIVMNVRAFVTLNPAAVYVSQPKVEPGCILRSSNWAVLQNRKLISQDLVNECRSRMNTFGFTGDIERADAAPKIDCVYQNDAAQNMFLNQPGGGAPPPETNKF